MTTPERLRRRQHYLGVYVFLIGIGLIVSSLYFSHQDAIQRACLADNFRRQNDVLTARAELATREANVTRLESQATRILFRDAFASKTKPEILAAYGDYRARLASVDQRRGNVAEERAETPVPTFAPGTCD